jgi:hypothetical protein
VKRVGIISPVVAKLYHGARSRTSKKVTPGTGPLKDACGWLEKEINSDPGVGAYQSSEIRHVIKK